MASAPLGLTPNGQWDQRRQRSAKKEARRGSRLPGGFTTRRSKPPSQASGASERDTKVFEAAAAAATAAGVGATAPAPAAAGAPEPAGFVLGKKQSRGLGTNRGGGGLLTDRRRRGHMSSCSSYQDRISEEGEEDVGPVRV